MSVIDQLPQFGIGISRIRSEARINAQEILHPIAVVSVVVRAILQNGREPERANTEILEIIQLGAYALKRSPLKALRWLIPLGSRSFLRIIKAIYHNEVNPGVTPVYRGRKLPLLAGVAYHLLKYGIMNGLNGLHDLSFLTNLQKYACYDTSEEVKSA
jgi:hypothetical protein